MKFYSFACCSALLLSGGAAAEKTAADDKLRELQAATRPPKASPTPPPTPGATRPPKPVPTDAPVTPSPTPASAQTIAETVCSMDEFFTLCSLIEMSPVVSDMLNGDGTYTLFAANNAAFDVILNMVDLSDDEIMGLLLYHIAPNLLTYNELLQIAPGKIETSVPGASIDVNANGDEVLLNGKVKITTKDIVASNGIIQVVDQVIIPEISAPTDSPTKGSTDSPTEAPVTPAPTLKPTEEVTPEPTPVPTLKPTEAQVDTMTPTISQPATSVQVAKIQSTNYPEKYIHVRSDDNVGIDEVWTLYNIVSPGLAGGDDTVSFEEVDRPGYFLRHQGPNMMYIMHANENDGTETFAQDATFKEVPGLVDPTNLNVVSFQSVNYPSRYIRHVNFNLFLHEVEGPDVINPSVVLADVSWMIRSDSSKPTQAPTTSVSLIKPIGTSAPTGEKWGVSPGAFSKAGKSKSKTAKTGGKSSKNSAKSGKSSKAEEVQGKTGKGDGKPGYHAMGSVKQRLGDVDGSLNARFRADFNDASLERGSSFVATVTMFAVAWYWQ